MTSPIPQSKRQLATELISVAEFALRPIVSVNKRQEKDLRELFSFVPVELYSPAMLPIGGEIGCTKRLRFARPLVRWKP